MKIYENMISVMKEVGAIGKDKTNLQQGFKYRGIDQVYNQLQPILAKHNIFTLPEIVHQERDERTNKNGTLLFYSRVTMKYHFVAEDGSKVECSVIGEGMDSGDKATNKAMAIAHKYALLQTFCIPTEDMPDPDSEVHEIRNVNKISEEQFNILTDLIIGTETDEVSFCGFFKIPRVVDLKADDFARARAMLEKKLGVKK